MNICLESGPHGTYIVRADNGRSKLIQSDFDHTALAETFGWCPPVGGATIANAETFLDEHVDNNEWVPDPGYFDEESDETEDDG